MEHWTPDRLQRLARCRDKVADVTGDLQKLLHELSVDAPGQTALVMANEYLARADNSMTAAMFTRALAEMV
jgi:hypothetical protein